MIADFVLFEYRLAFFADYLNFIAYFDVFVEKLVEHLPHASIALNHLHFAVEVMCFDLDEFIVFKTVLTVKQSQWTVANVKRVVFALNLFKAIRVDA